MKRSIFIGFDPREAAAFAVCRASILARLRRLRQPVAITGLVLDDLRARGLYRRPMERRDGQLWDPISEAPCATEFAISRFLVPHLAGSGWALFLDADMLVRADLHRLFALADPRYALMCVQHRLEPAGGQKMDGQAQTAYPRKNWSSVMLLNCDHPANQALTLASVNSLPGRDLHRFCWLPDGLIGGLDPEWNWLAGISPPAADPKIVHFTLGTPDMRGYEDQLFAEEWRHERARWARGQGAA